MNRALIAGLGIQGVAIAHGMHVLGHQVAGFDVLEGNIAKSAGILDNLGVPITTVHRDIHQLFVKGAHKAGSGSLSLTEYNPDVLISALPFHLNYEVAKKCVDHGVRYCDLGGNIDTSKRIAAYAKERAKKPVMTDLGLAPGIANVIAELGYNELGGADSVRIRVGGLPQKPKGSLKYGLTFSPQGLYNEYAEKCRVIADGELRLVDPLTDPEKIEFEKVRELVAFNTSGGLSNTLEMMLERGVRECNYKTIRFPGHLELVRFLLNECRLDLETFSQAVLNACGFITDDQVLIAIEIQKGEKKWSKKFRVLSTQTFTAMQKTTGLGTAAVAAILGSGAVDGKINITYSDIASEDFVGNLEKLLPEMSLRD
jgi:saccharopine dehydrogenase-like NADP-dependent oxidoreductase